MRNDAAKLWALILLVAIALMLGVRSLFIIDYTESFYFFAKKYKLSYSMLEVDSLDGFRDPGIEWSFERMGPNFLRASADFEIADEYDREYFYRVVLKRHPGANIDSSYYLLRGDVVLVGGDLCNNQCSAYILESPVRSTTYGALYSN